MPLTRKRVILAAIETSYGTQATVNANTHAVEVSELEITPLNAEIVERNRLKPFLGADEAHLGDKHVELSFSVSAAGSGVARNAPAWGALLRGCGMSETSSNVSVSYAPTSANFASLTFHVHRDGNLHKIVGARGTFTCELNASGYPTLSFTYRGLYATPSSASLPNADYSAFKPPVILSKGTVATLTLFGQTVAASSITLDMGVSAPFISYLNEEAVEITERNSSGRIEIKDPTLSPTNFFSKIEEAQTGALLMSYGKKAGQIVQFSAPKVQLVSPSYGDKEGIQTLAFDMRFLPNSGNDELIFTTK